jgi:hypothetical protein
MWQKKKKKKFDSYYLEIRTVKNSENFTMALIQCELRLKVYFKIKLFFSDLKKNQHFRSGNLQKRAWNFRG